MTDQERQAIAAIALLAAYADGDKSADEREEIDSVVAVLEGPLPMVALHRDVLLGKTTLESAAGQLSTRELKQLAYECALGVIQADGQRNAAEEAFLARLAPALGLSGESLQALRAGADALAGMPFEPDDADEAVDPEEKAAAEVASGKIFIGTGDSSTRAIVPSSPGGVAPAAAPDEEALDKMILDASILNGALELLPQGLASMAIIPLQMKLVYGIGKAHGHQLDRGAVKDLLVTMGAGVTGQYVEDIGRRLIGGLLGGRLLGGLARGATGAAFSFATTWAIGQVARRYYAGGRTMDAATLKASFMELVEEAKQLQARYVPQVEAQARSVDTSRLLDLIRGR
ncbi:MAG: GTPase [Burkholderiaceae bacterium]|nr:GTPase [Burkholderiaceae bacterium]